MKFNKKIGRRIIKIITLYGIQIWIILFIANIAVIAAIRYKAQAQSCMSQSQIDADSRCLYVLSGSIYKIGSRTRPHQRHPCGMDVTSIIPKFHNDRASKYLLPNFVAPFCSGNNNPTPIPTPMRTATAVPTIPPTASPTRTATAVPTRTATAIPTARPTAAPTSAPTNNPTTAATRTPTTAAFVAATRTPTSNPSATRTPAATRTPTTRPNLAANNSPTVTATPQIQLATTPSPSPQPTSLLFAIMASLTSSSPPPVSPTGVPAGIDQKSQDQPAPAKPITNSEESNLEFELIYWTTILSYVSFSILIITAFVWGFQKLKVKIKPANI